MEIEEKVSSDTTRILYDKVSQATKGLASCGPLEKDIYKERILQFVRELEKAPEGLSYLLRLVPKITESGFFEGGGWERVDKLLPELVRGTFLAGALYPYIEILSNLRVLCIAKSKVSSQYLTKEEAETFLIEVLAHNMDILFDTVTEENRVYENQLRIARRFFSFLTESIDNDDLFEEYSKEVIALAHQRPIVTDHISALIESGQELVDKNPKLKEQTSYKALEPFFKSVLGPTPLSNECEHPLDYRKLIKKLTPAELEKEALNVGALLRETGLGNIWAVILIRHLVRHQPDMVALCLGLNESGQAHLNEHKEMVFNIIKMAIRPSTSHTLYGLTCFLERHLLSQSSVLNGFKKLVEVSVTETVATRLLKRRKYNDSITPNAFLISGLISVLGQPLGIGQGKNPTCQAARALSLWSQYNPGYLIDTLSTVARNDVVQINFEGNLLNSTDYLDVNSIGFDPDLDPVSLIITPHLDALYGETLRRCQLRGEDPHKWVNPALYGRMVNFGFESVLDLTQKYVRDFENFVRRFYSTHHPEYAEESSLVYANPVGIFITSSHGALIGLHAVSIQRVVYHPETEHVRVYFYNPNNEGRQNWGQGIKPTVHGNGERMGESSLPFEHFAARLYAYHYNPFEEGDGFAVPNSVVNEVIALAKSSWGTSYHWI